MKGVEVHHGANSEERILVNAQRLIELMSKSDPNAGRRRAGALRHNLDCKGIDPSRLLELFPAMKEAYLQQPLDYGRNSRYGDKWKISCYLVVMENWKPRIQPHEPMVRCMGGIMNECLSLFQEWYCSLKALRSVEASVMNAFVTRYRPID